MMRVRAYENNAFLILANPFNALAVNPDGETISQNAAEFDEGIVYARFDLSKRDSDRGALVLRRPDVYGELVKTK
jgi:predicted amidohydrolase